VSGRRLEMDDNEDIFQLSIDDNEGFSMAIKQFAHCHMIDG